MTGKKKLALVLLFETRATGLCECMYTDLFAASICLVLCFQNVSIKESPNRAVDISKVAVLFLYRFPKSEQEGQVQPFIRF